MSYLIYLISIAIIYNALTPLFNLRKNSIHLIVVSTVSLSLAMIFLAILRWDIIGVWVAKIYLIVLALCFLLAALYKRQTRAKELACLPQWGKLTLVFFVFSTPLLTLYFLPAKHTNSAPKSDVIDFEFPLRCGRYYVVQGGAHAIYNHHHGVNAQRYALDITKLGAFGTRASGLTSNHLPDYYIYGEPVFAGCKGIIQHTTTGLRDSKIGASLKTDLPPEGNSVALKCGYATIIYAHLAKNINVKQGQSVSPETIMGYVANSGRSTEPHLHIHAVKGQHLSRQMFLFDASPLVMLFSGKELARNSIIENHRQSALCKKLTQQHTQKGPVETGPFR
ncbi:M23 family metallopeptidase [Polycladidibacter stylochi]|uniref:M23 family metallopeptidase n=1 Tax=Polycladidibacter stylochi TaxID=1807766 RepID=UPI00082CF37D|nr:M23 family metallopeptidase [Pseudovibrio stylochi]